MVNSRRMFSKWCIMQVVLYVDGVRVGEAAASGDTPHHIIHRLCEIDMDMAGDMQQPAQQGVGFTLKLPELQQGRHEVCCCCHVIASRYASQGWETVL